MSSISESIWEQARLAVVELGLGKLAVAEKFNIPRLELGQRAAQENWQAQREGYLLTFVEDTKHEAETHPLKDHTIVPKRLLKLCGDLAQQLLTERESMSYDSIKKTRLITETAARLAEAMEKAITLDRTVLGLRTGVPSMPVAQEPVEVEYYVNVKQNKEATAS